ncbi:hypothetical protein TNCV_832421 [Trichonephila clavipes]|nr:hypothetical protein TNCV_832421 [Trichonephila clavipes]
MGHSLQRTFNSKRKVVKLHCLPSHCSGEERKFPFSRNDCMTSQRRAAASSSSYLSPLPPTRRFDDDTLSLLLSGTHKKKSHTGCVLALHKKNMFPVVRTHDVLYNIRHPDYRKAQIKQQL